MTQKTRNGQVAALVALSAALLTACSGGGGDDDASASAGPTGGAPTEPVTISMAVWGGFGLDELVDTYEAANPGVTIDLQTGDYNPLHVELQSELVSGKGAPTIAAIGEDYIAQFVSQPDAFVDLRSLGAGDSEDEYLPWAWARGSNGDKQVGLPGNVAGLGLCYRADLLEAAGLPADRTELAALMGDSWDGFINVGKQYTEATGKPFVDSATPLLRAVRQQDGKSYYNAAGELNLEPIKPAFDTAINVVDAKISAGMVPFSDEWDKALSRQDFAATLCPMWGIGYIQANLSGVETAAVWDVAELPGPGGSWGGTYYAITASATTAERQAAWAFLSWLEQSDQQMALFLATGNLPAKPALYEEDSITEYTNAFFNGAPVGQLLAKSAADLTSQQNYAANNGTIEATLQQVLDEVQAGRISATDAWQVALDAAAIANGQEPSPSPDAGDS
jgi:cellobiose transport system substrate-binding protein